MFEVPTWSHDPSNQRLAERVPSAPADSREIASLAREMALEHGRSTYGEPSEGLTPADIYGERHAMEALERARRAKDAAERILEVLGVKP